MNSFKKMIWYLFHKDEIKVVKTLFASIRKEEEDKRLHEEHELYLQALDLSNTFDKELPNYDGYVEYSGTLISSNSWYEKYDISNAKNTAELLMWERIRAKPGNKKVDVSIIHTPYPWNDPWTIHYISRNMMDRFKNWRLYYKVKPPKRTTKKVAKNARPKKAKSKVR